jgi:DNA-binding SARP family transcriptional activator
MGRLQIRVLGIPEVRHEDQALKFRSRKVLALLLYLAIEGRKVAREKISALLWPESEEGAARATLRRTLADLRDALGESPTHTHLIVERDTLGFAFTPGDELDAQVVDAAFNLLRPPAAMDQTIERGALLDQLQPAVRLCRGSFMEGFSLGDTPDFDDWVDEQRAAWQRRMSLLYERLVQMQAEQGDMPGAVETANRWLAHDPLEESAYQRLMLLYLAAGNHRAALNVYAQCRKVLAEELRARPLPATQELAERIRHAASGASAVDERTGAASSPAQKLSLAVAPSRQVALETQMVGRASEHLTLVEIFEAVRQGQPRVVFITGEAGIGKTRITRVFLGWAHTQGADILQARAFETGGRLPYQPLVESFRPRLERENAPEDLLSDNWLAELTRLFPELRDRYPDLPAAAGDEMTARVRLYEAIVRLGQALAEKAPVVLALDDLHWADEATLDVLHYAARRWRENRTPILLLLNLRSENPSRIGSLSEWMAGLEQSTETVHLHLEALTYQETLQLLEMLALSFDQRERERAETFARWLYNETRGQPLYVTETLKALLERGLLTRRLRSDGQWRIDFLTSSINEAEVQRFLPPGVREAIRVQLNQVAADSFSLLVAAAVLGRAASFEQLCLVAGLDEQAGLPALDELLHSRFLREGGVGEATFDPLDGDISTGTYFFTHDKVRDVVYSEAGEARRRVFHRRALEGLPMAPASEHVQHALAAGLREQAFSLCLAAGDDAMQIFAVNDARIFYQQALRLLPTLQKAEPLTDIQHAYSQLGRTYELTHRIEEAERTYQDMLTYAQQVHAVAMECAALSRLAILAVQTHLDFAHATSLLQRALSRAEQINDRALIADVEWHLAQLGFYDFDAPKIIAHGQRALAIARELGAVELMARCLNVLSYGKKQGGQLGEAERYAGEARTLFQSMGNRAMEVDSMCVMASICMNQGRVEEGLALARTAYDVSTEIGNVWGQVNSMYHLAFVSLERGAVPEALEMAERCVTLTEEFKLQVLQVNGYILLGIVQRTLGARDEACTTHVTALDLAQQIASPALKAAAAIELCTDYALLERWRDAETAALEAATGKSNLFVLAFGLSRWHVTEALLRSGQVQLAIEDLERWKARIEESPRHRISYLHAVAVLAHTQGRNDSAIAALQEALALAQALQLESEQKEIEAALQAEA